MYIHISANCILHYSKGYLAHLLLKTKYIILLHRLDIASLFYKVLLLDFCHRLYTSSQMW